MSWSEEADAAYLTAADRAARGWMRAATREALARLAGDAIALDCLECSSRGSVRNDVCEICGAELDDAGVRTVDLPPAVLTTPDTYTFTDVVRELAAIARGADHPDAPWAVQIACRRAQILLDGLYRQFTSDVLAPRPPREISRTDR